MKTTTLAMAATSDDAPLSGLAARLERYALVLVAVLLGTVAIAAALSDAPDATRIGGDYPAFFAAGRIVLDGDVAALYETGRQAAAQASLFPEEGAFLYFAYPPYVAAAYAPLAAITFQWSLIIHVLAMAIALFATVRLAARWFPIVARHPWLSTAVALFFYPMLRAVVGGQNTALTLLLVTAAAALETDERHELGGAVAALLLYKPQFGVPIALLLVVARRWRMLRGWAITAAALFLIGTAMQGLGWVSEWWSQAAGFAEQNVDVNGNLFISIPGVLTHSAESGVATALGWLWTGAVAAAVAWFWWRSPNQIIERYAVAVAGLVAILPQPLYYEAGLLLLPLAVVLAWQRMWWFAFAVWAVGWTQLAAETLGFSPLVLLALAGAAFVLWKLRAAGPVRGHS